MPAPLTSPWHQKAALLDHLAARLIATYGVTHWTCIPTMIIDLFASPNYRSFDLSSLRYLSGGGAAMPQAVAERLLINDRCPVCQQEFKQRKRLLRHAEAKHPTLAAMMGSSR